MSDLETIPNPPIGALTVSGFGRVYNIGRTRIYEEIRAGRLRAVKVGTKKSLIRRCDAEAWAAALPPMVVAR